MSSHSPGTMEDNEKIPSLEDGANTKISRKSGSEGNDKESTLMEGIWT